MITREIQKQSFPEVIKLKVKAYAELLKFRLSLLVSISAVFGYAVASTSGASWGYYLLIGLGGMMITGASNALNQLMEREYDGLMKRTAQRPLPTQRISEQGALIFALIMGIAGVALLGYFFNLATALLGIIGLLSYAFVYTPMKRVSRASVFVGAIPGSLPPLIGWVAATGNIELGGLILFVFQFFWQFPHFWAIAWLLDEDYERAGFKMLPSASGKSSFTASLILLYTLSLIPLVAFALLASLVSWTGAGILVLLGLAFAFPAWRLFKTLDSKYARKLMFFSFLYLPLIQLTFLFG